MGANQSGMAGATPPGQDKKKLDEVQLGQKLCVGASHCQQCSSIHTGRPLEQWFRARVIPVGIFLGAALLSEALWASHTGNDTHQMFCAKLHLSGLR